MGCTVLCSVSLVRAVKQGMWTLPAGYKWPQCGHEARNTIGFTVLLALIWRLVPRQDSAWSDSKPALFQSIAHKFVVVALCLQRGELSLLLLVLHVQLYILKAAWLLCDPCPREKHISRANKLFPAETNCFAFPSTHSLKIEVLTKHLRAAVGLCHGQKLFLCKSECHTSGTMQAYPGLHALAMCFVSWCKGFAAPSNSKPTAPWRSHQWILPLALVVR